jgi:DNA-directed RNA polymerase subunit M/transcription elongation factor TFIIS
MRLPWQPAEYARTCTQCGYTWQVPRWAARRRVGTINKLRVTQGRSVNRAELARQVDAIEARNQQADTFRVCPRCGAETFTQQPVRSKAADISA